MNDLLTAGREIRRTGERGSGVHERHVNVWANWGGGGAEERVGKRGEEMEAGR